MFSTGRIYRLVPKASSMLPGLVVLPAMLLLVGDSITQKSSMVGPLAFAVLPILLTVMDCSWCIK